MPCIREGRLDRMATAVVASDLEAASMLTTIPIGPPLRRLRGVISNYIVLPVIVTKLVGELSNVR
jgi:hypothetical protein